MRFGVCAGMDKAALVAHVGWDYIELGASSALCPEADIAVWEAKRVELLALPLPCETFNLFVPRHLRITGREVDEVALTRYVHTALARAAEVGGRVIVFGSGGARQVPEGFSAEQAEEQLLRFLHVCADAHETTGVVVAIEPLNRQECNVIHTVEEGTRLARLVGRPGVQNLADTYHMERNGESLETILAGADVLVHVHTADTDRKAPGTGHFDHVALFQMLQKATYDARVSIECSFTHLEEELEVALAHLKAAARAGKIAP